jgi:hypothetical protein
MVNFISTASSLGHEFAIPTPSKLIQTVQKNDQDKFVEDLAIEREEPEQIEMIPVAIEPIELPTEKQRIDGAIEDLKEYLVAAEEMQRVLGEKLKNRRVTVDPKQNPAVRDAIRRLFGEDSNTITYNMYKEALRLRSELLTEGRNNTYGTSS